MVRIYTPDCMLKVGQTKQFFEVASCLKNGKKVGRIMKLILFEDDVPIGSKLDVNVLSQDPVGRFKVRSLLFT